MNSHFSKGGSELLDALHAQTSLLLDDVRSEVSSQIAGAAKSVVITGVAYAAIGFGSVLLVYFTIRETLQMAGVDLRFTMPVFALIILLIGIILNNRAAGQHKIKQQERLQDIKAIARFKREVADSLNNFKFIIKNPLRYTRDQSIKFIESLNAGDNTKYKSVILVFMALGAYVVVEYFTNSKLKTTGAQKSEKGTQDSPSSSTWTPLRSSITALVTIIIKEVVVDTLLKSILRTPSAESREKTTRPPPASSIRKKNKVYSEHTKGHNDDNIKQDMTH
jgi:hypothetical protein